MALAAGITSASRAARPESASGKGVDYFENKIRPLLADNCYACHSRQSRKAKGGLLLDSRERLLKGGDSGPVVLPGDPDQSLLIKAVRYNDQELQMPPDGKKLTGAQVADLEAWVKMGAPFPGTAVGESRIASSSHAHWAFQPVNAPAIPSVKNECWVKSPVDAFILARLEASGMEPAPPADKRTLIRRATYDLTGLPPTPEEVAAFVADESPEAFGHVVDRLLASPSYGERWGRHWLDVARYASSDSPYAYTYRDYVIRSFNDDLPYDQFILQQLAADQLDLGGNKQPLAGLAFLTIGRQFENGDDTLDDRIDTVTRGMLALSVSCARCHDHKYDPIPTRDYYALHGVFASSVAPSELPVLASAPDPRVYAAYLAKRKPLVARWDAFSKKQRVLIFDQHRGQTAQYLLLSHNPAKIAELEGEAFGLSDRKILRTGSVRWQKALEKLDRTADPIFVPWFAFAALPTSEFAARAKPLSAQIVANRLAHPVNSLVATAFGGEPPASLKEVAERYGKLFADIDKEWQEHVKRDPNSQALPTREQEALRQVFYSAEGPGNLPAEIIPSLYNVPALMQIEPIQGELMRLDATHPGAPPRAMALVDSPQPKNSRVFIRGNPNRLGEEAPRQFLTVLSGDQARPFTHGSGRLELARAIASKGNPLTARVIVNRVWLHHFGTGLLATADDFGLRSDPPSHPELLDYLASWFMREGWSIKNLHRILMLSSVYQESSDDNLRYQKKDPDNRLFAKMNRRRLDFESMRDTLLYVAGNLDRSMGGRPVELVKRGSARDPAFSGRRTVYGIIDRNDLVPMFRIFDFANPDMTTAQRDITTVPLQSLFFLNGSFVIGQACQLIKQPAFERLGGDTSQIRLLYQRLYQRDPCPDEIGRGLRFLAAESASTEPKNGRSLTAWERYGQVLLMANELMFVD